MKDNILKEDPTPDEIEKAAARQAISRMGEIAEKIGVNKPLAQYSTEEFEWIAVATGRAYAREVASWFWLFVNGGENIIEERAKTQAMKGTTHELPI